MDEKTPPRGSAQEKEAKEAIVLEIRTSAKQITEALQGLSGRVAIMQKDIIGMRENVTAMTADFAEARVKRLSEEILQVEKEKKILEERMKLLDEQLDLKKGDSIQAINTTDKIKQAAGETYEQRERTEQEQRAAAWRKRLDTVITAVMVSTAVGIVGSVLTALWWFFTFYLSNR